MWGDLLSRFPSLRATLLLFPSRTSPSSSHRSCPPPLTDLRASQRQYLSTCLSEEEGAGRRWRTKSSRAGLATSFNPDQQPHAPRASECGFHRPTKTYNRLCTAAHPAKERIVRLERLVNASAKARVGRGARGRAIQSFVTNASTALTPWWRHGATTFWRDNARTASGRGAPFRLAVPWRY